MGILDRFLSARKLDQYQRKLEANQLTAQECLSFARALLYGHFHGSRQMTENPVAAIAFLQRAEQLGSVEATVALGVCYAQGSGVGLDYKRAAECYQRAMSGRGGHNSRACFEYLRSVKPGSMTGASYATVLYEIGAMLDKGSGTSEDKREAAKFFQRSAELGNAEAELQLGQYYARGQGGLPVDLSKAVGCYQRALDKGASDSNVRACFSALRRVNPPGMSKQNYARCLNAIGVRLYRGNTITANHVQARKFCECSAKLGYATAYINLGAWYASGLLGLPVDLCKAAEYYQKALEKGRAWSKVKCALVRLRAAKPASMTEIGYANTLLDIGYRLHTELAFTGHHAEAVAFYKCSARRGCSVAYYNLGVCYLNGECGLSVSLVEAAHCFQFAKQLNHDAKKLQVVFGDIRSLASAEELHEIADLLRDGLKWKTLSNLPEAMKFYHSAAVNGNTASLRELGKCYQHGGKELNKSLVYAAVCFQLAKQAGHNVTAVSRGVAVTIEEDFASLRVTELDASPDVLDALCHDWIHIDCVLDSGRFCGMGEVFKLQPNKAEAVKFCLHAVKYAEKIETLKTAYANLAECYELGYPELEQSYCDALIYYIAAKQLGLKTWLDYASGRTISVDDKINDLIESKPAGRSDMWHAEQLDKCSQLIAAEASIPKLGREKVLEARLSTKARTLAWEQLSSCISLVEPFDARAWLVRAQRFLGVDDDIVSDSVSVASLGADNDFGAHIQARLCLDHVFPQYDSLSASVKAEYNYLRAVACCSAVVPDLGFSRSCLFKAQQLGHPKAKAMLKRVERECAETVRQKTMGAAETAISAAMSIQDRDGNTFLHRAARYGHYRNYERFLMLGVNQSIKNKQGKIASELFPVSSREGADRVRRHKLTLGKLHKHALRDTAEVVWSAIQSMGNVSGLTLGDIESLTKLGCIAPLFDFAKLALIARHRLSKHKCVESGYDSDDFEVETTEHATLSIFVTSSSDLGRHLADSGVRSCSGIAYIRENQLHVATGATCGVQAVLVHELAHLAMHELYDNDANPYAVGSPEEQEFIKIRQELFANKDRLDPLLAGAFDSGYSSTEYDGELIVRILEVVVVRGVRVAETSVHERLWRFYKEKVLPTLVKHVATLNTRMLGGWSPSVFQPSPSAPPMLEEHMLASDSSISVESLDSELEWVSTWACKR